MNSDCSTKPRIALICSALMMITALGCASPVERTGGRQLELTEFVATAPIPDSTAENGVPTVSVSDRAEEAITSQIAPDATTDAAIRPGGSTPPQDRFVPVGEPMVIDSLIGQVNGRPIFAEEFFDPIADQLRAEAAGKTARQFSDAARPIIYDRLVAVVLNELYLAEAEAALTTDQRTGLRYLLESFEEQQVRLAQGSRTETDQRLLEEQGITLNELREIARNEVLIRNLIRLRIQPRVIVAWKDIEREYQRRFGEFNQPGRITLGRIALFTEPDAELIAQATEAFADGQTFEDVVQIVGAPGDGEWRSLALPAEGIAQLPLAQPYTQQLAGLEVGQHAGPFEVGDRTIWVKIMAIEQPPGRSIYDPQVQRLLRSQLESRRENEEMIKYRLRLLQDGSVDDIDTMAERLLEIALRRYAVSLS